MQLGLVWAQLPDLKPGPVLSAAQRGRVLHDHERVVLFFPAHPPDRGELGERRAAAGPQLKTMRQPGRRDPVKQQATVGRSGWTRSAHTPLRVGNDTPETPAIARPHAAPSHLGRRAADAPRLGQGRSGRIGIDPHDGTVPESPLSAQDHRMPAQQPPATDHTQPDHPRKTKARCTSGGGHPARVTQPCRLGPCPSRSGTPGHAITVAAGLWRPLVRGIYRRPSRTARGS